MTDSDWRWFRRNFGLRALGCSGGCLGLIAVAVNLFFIGLAGMAGTSLDPRLDILGTALLPSIGCVLLGAFGAWLSGEHILPVDIRPRSHQLGAVLMGIAGLGLTTICFLYIEQGNALTDLVRVAYFFPAACLLGASIAAIAKTILRS